MGRRGYNGARDDPDDASGPLDDAPGPLEHATPDVELANAQLALGRPDLADAQPADDDDAELDGDVNGGGDEGGGGALAAAGAAAPDRRRGPASRLINFLQGSWRELQRVQWPDRRQVMQATGVVIGFVIVAGVFLGVADLVAGKAVTFILK